MDKGSKIFGIGLPRTGTTSLHNALIMLRIKSYHHPLRLYTSLDSSILENNDAFVDSPIPLIFKELDDNFPGSKFILTTRSLESWLESMEWLFEHGSAKWNTSETIYKYRREFLGCEKFNKAILTKKYIDFHNDVMKYFEKRKEDLLVMNIEENANYENLCKFLGLDKIKIEYPKSNKRTHVSLIKRLIFHYVIRNIKKIILYFYMKIKNYFD